MGRSAAVPSGRVVQPTDPALPIDEFGALLWRLDMMLVLSC